MERNGMPITVQTNWRIYGEGLDREIKKVEALDLSKKERGVSVYLSKHILYPFIELRNEVGQDVFMRDISEFIQENKNAFESFMDKKRA